MYVQTTSITTTNSNETNQNLQGNLFSGAKTEMLAKALD